MFTQMFTQFTPAKTPAKVLAKAPAKVKITDEFARVHFDPSNIVFHQWAVPKFVAEVINSSKKRYSFAEKKRIENYIKMELKDVNFYDFYGKTNKVDAIPSSKYLDKYPDFRDLIFAKKPSIGNVLERESGREGAEILLENVKNKISTYTKNYKGTGPKDGFVKKFLTDINYDMTKNSSDLIADSLTKELDKLQREENNYYKTRVSSCFSCFTFFFQKRSSLQPLINEAKKLVETYETARKAEAAKRAKLKENIPSPQLCKQRASSPRSR